MEEIVLTKENFSGDTTISRQYIIYEINYSYFTDKEKQEILDDANNIIKNAHNGTANSNINRNQKTKENDAFAGILAEFAIMKFLNTVKPNSAYRPPVTSTKNQIDIFWKYKNTTYSLEVRSSFVQNGIAFALYAIDRSSMEPYFDILGPYYQEYKTTYDTQKDVYARVLFNGSKYNVKERFLNNYENFYIIGFMDGEKLISLNKHKNLKGNATFSKLGSKYGDYRVAPIDKITDVKSFLTNISKNSLNPFKEYIFCNDKRE